VWVCVGVRGCVGGTGGGGGGGEGSCESIKTGGDLVVVVVLIGTNATNKVGNSVE
jgi:hypothetical protein